MSLNCQQDRNWLCIAKRNKGTKRLMQVHGTYGKLSKDQFNFTLENTSCTGIHTVQRDSQALLQHQHGAKLQEVVL